MRKLLIAVAMILAAQTVAAGKPRVLLPLYLARQTPGAFGSLWVSEFTVHNASATGSYIIDWCVALDPNQGCALDLRSDEELIPGETETALPARYPVPQIPVAGAILILSTDATSVNDLLAENLAFNLRIVDVSRSATAAGTEMPVVREREFRISTINLLNVPVDNRFRLALRMFEMNLSQATFKVRIFDQTTNALLSERSVTTTTGGVLPRGFTPAFAELDDIASGSTAQTTQLRVEIEPLTTGSASWAYVSITNNDSQQITLVTPQ
jgi:hypothetical protein